MAMSTLIIAPQMRDILGVTSKDKTIELIEIGIKKRLSTMLGRNEIFKNDRLIPTKMRMTKKVKVKYLIWV